MGPIFARLPGEVPDEVREAAARHPSIYCAMGSSANCDLLKMVLAGFAGTPYSVIAPVRAHLRDMAGDTVPPNVLVTDWIPALEVNPLVNAAVIHGGQGTVQTACASGIPFVGIGMQPEQEANIESIARFGCAIRLRRRRLTRSAVVQAVDALLREERFRRRARDVQRLMHDWDGPANAARSLRERFAREGA